MEKSGHVKRAAASESCIRFKKLEKLNSNVALELVKKASGIVKKGGVAL